jgi:pimeloyl-ACP methyl ester carboxylesterase
MYITIGGIEQWIQFNEDKPDHPILLYLHGGPGGTSAPAAAAWKPWEEHFTLVHWDQRGANRTFRKNGAEGCGRLTIERMLADGIEVAEFLISSLRKSKILLVGHSWGSILAVYMLKRRPELFSAFVGTGQVVHTRRNIGDIYRRLIQRSERIKNHEALRALRSMGPPPYSDQASFKVLLEWAERLAEGDGDPIQPRPQPFPADFSMEEVPIFFFQGVCDPVISLELSEEYFASIVAPHKEFVRFEGCHHFFMMNRPDAFLRELLGRVRPWPLKADTRCRGRGLQPSRTTSYGAVFSDQIDTC